MEKRGGSEPEPRQKNLKDLDPTYRYKDVQQVLQRGQLREELLHHLTEGLEDGVVIDAGKVEAEEDRGQKVRPRTSLLDLDQNRVRPEVELVQAGVQQLVVGSLVDVSLRLDLVVV